MALLNTTTTPVRILILPVICAKVLTNIVDDQIEAEKAFGPNVKRLQDVKTQYDPENVFYKWHGLFHRV